MSEMNELYQAVILDHNQRPQNFGKLEAPTHQAEGYNPLCGDQLTVYASVRDGVIDDVRFEGSGWSIATRRDYSQSMEGWQPSKLSRDHHETNSVRYIFATEAVVP